MAKNSKASKRKQPKPAAGTQNEKADAPSKYDTEHTYEFLHHGKNPWKRPGSTEVVAPGMSFRALSYELKEIEDAGPRFEHVRTFGYPPLDLARAVGTVSGMQRKEPPQSAASTKAAPKQRSADASLA